MKRLGRWAFNILVGVSLVLCVTTVVLWVRSYRVADTIGYSGQHHWWLYFSSGRLVWQDEPRSPYRFGLDAMDDTSPRSSPLRSHRHHLDAQMRDPRREDSFGGPAGADAGQSFVGLGEAERTAGMSIKGAVVGPQPTSERQWAAGRSSSGKTFDPLAR